MVLHIEPVAHLLPVAVDREGLAGEGVMDDQRNELLREVVGAVVIRAVRRQNWQAVGVMVGADKMIRGSLARRIRTIWLVLLGLCEGRIGGSKGAIDLIGRDMQESEIFLGLTFEAIPVGAGRLKEIEGADDISLNELTRSMNGAVDMVLRLKID